MSNISAASPASDPIGNIENKTPKITESGKELHTRYRDLWLHNWFSQDDLQIPQDTLMELKKDLQTLINTCKSNFHDLTPHEKTSYYDALLRLWGIELLEGLRVLEWLGIKTTNKQDNKFDVESVKQWLSQFTTTNRDKIRELNPAYWSFVHGIAKIQEWYTLAPMWRVKEIPVALKNYKIIIGFMKKLG